MDTNIAPKLNFFQRALLDDAERTFLKAQRRGVTPLFKVYSPKKLALLEAHGWRVHTHTPSSYGAPNSWLVTRD